MLNITNDSSINKRWFMKMVLCKSYIHYHVLPLKDLNDSFLKSNLQFTPYDVLSSGTQ